MSHHVHAASFLVELHAAVDEGEERVVTTDADAETWMHLRSALADEDVTSDDGLATELFHAEALAAESRPFLTEPCPFLWAIKVGW